MARATGSRRHAQPVRLVFRFYPQRTAMLLTAGGHGTRARVTVSTASLAWVKTTSWKSRESPSTVDPTGRFLYGLGDANFGIEGNRFGQFRIGADGTLTPLNPPTVEGRHGPLTFHPNGKFAYLSQGHGYIIQFRVARGGQLVFEHDSGDVGDRGTGRYPSAIRFDRSNRYAYVTYVDDVSATEPNGTVSNRVYSVGRDGHLKTVQLTTKWDRFVKRGDNVIWEHLRH